MRRWQHGESQKKGGASEHRQGGVLRAGSEGGLAKFSEGWEAGLGQHITGHPRYPEAPVLAPDSAAQPHCRGERQGGTAEGCLASLNWEVGSCPQV